jgi:GPI mannosyltransferase 3
VFFNDPLRYLQERFPPNVSLSFPLSPYPVTPPGVSPPRKDPWIHEWPRNLIFFGALLEVDGVQNLLEQKGYKEVWKRGRSWEGDEDERKGGVRVWKWQNQSPVESS